MSKESEIGILDKTMAGFREIVEKNNLLDVDVTVLVKPLTPEEAIGMPGRRDFPIIIGKERVIEAEFLGSNGHAYTDSPREFVGVLKDVLNLELNTNQNRAIYIATLNAVLGSLKMVDKTVHCKDEEPEECALDIADFLLKKYGKTDVGLIGLNPAIAERLIDAFGPDHVHITDLSKDNIGKRKFGVEIWDGSKRTEDLIEVSDVIIFTGTTLVNDTFTQIWNLIQSRKKKYLVYGVTAAGVCQLLDIERICPRGRDGLDLA
ncbi:MAG: hypothetical protein KKG33_15120 [candidate division Zixibacteria bacterium]|nr:hypothetical protein [candidate division Zixibacteria bacterium]MBU1470529.1 hypothetical protein [candidate division Zixibacteria bacterium]MBU2626883.1 hypothetical protein [candidate division Zixibacteria bacterium]